MQCLFTLLRRTIATIIMTNSYNKYDMRACADATTPPVLLLYIIAKKILSTDSLHAILIIIIVNELLCTTKEEFQVHWLADAILK